MSSALLLSGGMDSIALAWWKRPSIALTIDYGQLAAEAEIAASRAVCETLGIRHELLRVDLRALGSGDMAGAPAAPQAPASDWWPFRNQLLVTLAAMVAIRHSASELWIGTVATDGTHADGTAQFVQRLHDLVALQEGALQVRAPALNLTTAELVRMSGVPMQLLAWAHSCHKATVPCGNCRGCNKFFEVWHALQDEARDGTDA